MTRIDEIADAGRAVIIGSGVAGLTAALSLGDCTVLTKTALGAGSSDWAQGGIAAAVGEDDTPQLHEADTVRVSGGIADLEIAGLVTDAAPERIAWLRELGARFDTDGAGRLTLGREAGHSRRRIVHADGDATGAELMRTLRTAVASRPDIQVAVDTTAIDLITVEGVVTGVLVERPGGRRVAMLAEAVVLATGGIGRIYAHTTNPPEVTGDGLAMAARVGAAIADVEFVQFHPTALDAGLDPMPLLTEALRGEGAVLLDDEGRRFMSDIHPDAELAPRDVVAREVWRLQQAGRKVLLDATEAVGERFPDRFPTVWSSAVDAGYDPRHQPLPVAPAAHYHMGGIAVDAWGTTSVPGLWACGEAASTGLHGANRLASNSLLEGLVFGTRVASAVAAAPRPPRGTPTVPAAVPDALHADPQDLSAIRDLMWRYGSVVRTGEGLTAGLAELDRSGSAARSVEGKVALEVARLVLDQALRRTESRGGHHRADFPAAQAVWARRSLLTPTPVPRAAVAARRVA